MPQSLPPTILKQVKRHQETLIAFQKRDLDPQTFCLVPFTNLILDPGGNICVCRHKGTEMIIGNLKEQSLEEIWNGEFLQRWRREFLQGKPQICEKEMAHQKCQQCQYNNQLLPKIELKELISTLPLKLTANLNGQCNLKCQMCHVWKLPNGYYNEENFWKPGREGLFRQLQEIDMLSGEPFIQADTFRLIDEVSAVNPTCKWMFTTNAHYNFTPKIEQALDKIDIKYLVISVDSFDQETYAKIRPPGKISVVLKAVESFLRYRQERKKQNRNFEIHLNFLTQKDNFKELKTVLQFCLSRDIIPMITFLYEPEQFSLLTLDHRHREMFLENIFSELTPLEQNLCSRVIIPLIQSLDHLSKASSLLEFERNNLLLKQQLYDYL
jgi:radical SAM protein with 4Fe4S-binding SPASM domain